MGGGKAKRDAEALRPPGALAVGPAPLGRDLGGTLLSPVIEQACEKDRLISYRTRQFVQPVKRDIRVRRDEIEVPINGDGHGEIGREEGESVDGDRSEERRVGKECRSRW